MDPQVHIVLCCFLQESYCEESTITWYFQINELDECINTQTSTLIHLWQLLRDHKLGPFMVRCVAPNVGMSIWSLFLTRYLNSVYNFSLMSFCVSVSENNELSCLALFRTWIIQHKMSNNNWSFFCDLSSEKMEWRKLSALELNLFCFVLF